MPIAIHIFAGICSRVNQLQADDHLVIIMQMIDFSFLTFQFSARVENNGLAGAEKKTFLA